MTSKVNSQLQQTEIGAIPIDWKVKKIKEVAKINELNVDSSSDYKKMDYIDISSIKEGRVVEIKKILIDQAPTRAKRIVRDNDILISTVRPNLRHYAFIAKGSDRLIASTGFAVITAKGVNPQYLYYYVTSEDYIKYLAAIADTHTSTYPAFTPDIIETSLMPFPSLAEQEKIGKALFELDAKIELNIRTNHTLEAIGREFLKHWFVDFEFPNDIDAPYKTSGGEMVYSEKVGKEIPKGWRLGSIGDIVYVQAGFAFKSNELLENGNMGVVKIKNISNNVVDIKDTQYVSRETIAKLDRRFLIEPGSVLIAMTGSKVGKLGIVPRTDRKLWLNQRVGIFREKIDKGLYLIYLILTSNKYQRILKDRAFGTVQPNISCSDIESIELVLPPKENIAKFGFLFESFFQRIIGNLYENEKLSELRENLLPKLISGELRLNQFQKAIF